MFSGSLAVLKTTKDPLLSGLVLRQVWLCRLNISKTYAIICVLK